MHCTRNEVDANRVCFGSSDCDGASVGIWHGYQFASTSCAFIPNGSKSRPPGDVNSPGNHEPVIARGSSQQGPPLTTGFPRALIGTSRDCPERRVGTSTRVHRSKTIFSATCSRTNCIKRLTAHELPDVFLLVFRVAFLSNTRRNCFLLLLVSINNQKFARASEKAHCRAAETPAAHNAVGASLVGL